MAVVYATLIIKGKKTLEQVPVMLREQVAEMLADLEVTDQPPKTGRFHSGSAC